MKELNERDLGKKQVNRSGGPVDNGSPDLI